MCVCSGSYGLSVGGRTVEAGWSVPADVDVCVCVCVVGPTDCLLEGELLKLGGPFLQM